LHTKLRQRSHPVLPKPHAHPPAELGDAAEFAPDPRRWKALAILLAAAFLGVLDFFIVNVSIPSIEKGLYASSAEIQLTIASYGLAYAVFLITGGRLGDLYGRKRMFLLGVAGFTFASALCGVAPNPETLIGARVLQGLAGSLMFPQVLSIIQVTFPRSERGRAFSILGMVAGTGSFSGNVLGGVLVQFDLFGLGWRPIFLVNLPIGLLALWATRRLVRESRAPGAVGLDWGGIVIATLGLVLLIYPLAEGREAGWPAWAFVCLAAAPLVLAAFLRYERWLTTRGGTPLVELGLFRDRVFVYGLLTTVVYYGGLSAFFLAFTYFLQYGLGLSPLETGLTFAPFAVGFLVASNRTVPILRRLGSWTIQLGIVLMGVGLVAVITLTAVRGIEVSALSLALVLLIYGTGQGFVMPTLLTTVLSGVPHAAAGSASGVLSTVQQVALALGVAVIGSIFFAALGVPVEPAGFVRAIGVALSVNLGLLAVAFALVFLLPRWPAGTVRHAEL
jgi:EmrB/QacA subfamily drug resistance transporter